MGYLSPREYDCLVALKQAGDSGLDKKEASKQIDTSVFMADLALHMLKGQGYAIASGNRFYITDAGMVRADQQQLAWGNI